MLSRGGRLAAIGLVAAAAAGTGLWATTTGATPTVVPKPSEVSTNTYSGGTITFVAVGPTKAPTLIWAKADGSSQTVTLAVDKKTCAITNLGSVDPILKIRSTANANGTDLRIVENGLGIGTNCNTGSGRVSQGQTLQISLGSAVLASGQGITVATSSLNVEGKFRARLNAAISTDGTNFGSATTYPLGNASDNGSDSGPNDNTPVTVTGPFTAIQLAPYADGKGQIAIDDGGDGTNAAAAATVFTLQKDFEYTVACGSVVAPTPASQITESGGTGVNVGTVRFTRFGNKGGAPCPDNIGLNINIVGDGATEGGAAGGEERDLVQIVPGGSTEVRARVEITWTVDRLDGDGNPRSVDDINAELQREIQYPDGPVHAVTLCTSYRPGVVGPQYQDYFVERVDGELWCVLEDHRSIQGDKIVQYMVLDVNGDPKMF